MSTFGFALVGCGSIAKKHAHAVHEYLEDASIAAFVDTDIARARENNVSVIRADVAGRVDGLESFGSSGIVNQHGTVLQAARQLEVGLIIAEIETKPAPRVGAETI